MLIPGLSWGSVAIGMEEVMQSVINLSQQSVVVIVWVTGSGQQSTEHGGSPAPCVNGGIEPRRRALKAFEHCLAHRKCSLYA